MKKKIVSGLLATTMVASLLFGCGGADTTEAPATEAPAATEATDDAAETTEAAEEVVVEDTGKVLNIYCWNEEFKTRVTDHYPGYEEVDATNGKIGDIEVKWNITPNQDNAYQNNLDETLLKQADAAADDKIDMFLVEADYALKYVDSDYTMAIADLGITDADLAEQYQYTKDIVTDGNGVLKGLSWQGCPGVLFYNREAAKEVLGSDDPAEVQKAVADWATFNKTAADMQAKGYSMISSVNDSYRVYSNNVTSKWVVDGKVNIDDNIMAWVDDSKALVDAGATKTHDLWSDDWSKGFFPEGKVFAYFGPAWLVNFSMSADVEGSIGYNGGWGATEGPQGFYWGGTWICAATGTDNAGTIKDIMLKLTCDADIMKGIVEKDDDFVNNKGAMDAMAASDYSSKILGGQNPLAIYSNGVATLDLSNISAYDQGCNEEFQKAMKNYFDGNATKDEAIAAFKKAIVEKYPELTAE
ncbi:MAG: ABC transporter substrate-binding protein [Lachnospiraceae bacterium]|nr:ABC transporter substrate-binding protein [Lachnospiraceae bacterium]